MVPSAMRTGDFLHARDEQRDASDLVAFGYSQ